MRCSFCPSVMTGDVSAFDDPFLCRWYWFVIWRWQLCLMQSSLFLSYCCCFCSVVKVPGTHLVCPGVGFFVALLHFSCLN